MTVIDPRAVSGERPLHGTTIGTLETDIKHKVVARDYPTTTPITAHPGAFLLTPAVMYVCIVGSQLLKRSRDGTPYECNNWYLKTQAHCVVPGALGLNLRWRAAPH